MYFEWMSQWGQIDGPGSGLKEEIGWGYEATCRSGEDTGPAKTQGWPW